MPTTIHHHDGMVAVWQTNADRYRENENQFAQDYGSPFPPLPDGVTERIYQQNVRHALIANNSVVDGGPMPWPEGDDIADALPQLLGKVQARAQIGSPLDMGKTIAETIGS